MNVTAFWMNVSWICWIVIINNPRLQNTKENKGIGSWEKEGHGDVPLGRTLGEAWGRRGHALYVNQGFPGAVLRFTSQSQPCFSRKNLPEYPLAHIVPLFKKYTHAQWN